MARVMNRKTVMVILGMLLLLSPLITACGKSQETRTVVKIGFVGSLTGAAATSGAGFLAGYQVYFNYANEENLIPGVRIALDIYDTAYDPAREILGYQKLKGDGVVAILTFSGSAADKYRPLCDQDKIPIISNSTSKVQLVPSGYVFGIIVPFEWQSQLVLQYIHDNWDYAGKGRNPKVAVLGWNMAYGGDHVKAAKAFYSDYNVDLVLAETVPVNTMDMSVNARRVGEAKADYAMLPLLAGPCASVMKELYVKYPGQVTAIIPAASFKEYFSAMGANVLEGHYFTGMGQTFDVHGAAMDLLRDLMNRYYPSGWSQYDNACPSITFPGALAMVDAIKRVVEEKGVNEINSVNIYEALQKVDIDLEGISSEPIKFGPDIRLGVVGQNYWKCVGGTTQFVLWVNNPQQKWVE